MALLFVLLISVKPTKNFKQIAELFKWRVTPELTAKFREQGIYLRLRTQQRNPSTYRIGHKLSTAHGGWPEATL